MEILNAILYGIALGAGTLLFIGPVLFYLLKASAQGGVKAGVYIALGIITGDLVYVILVVNGFGEYVTHPEVKAYMALGGAILLLFMAFKFLFSKVPLPTTKVEILVKNNLSYFAQGFLINFVNPFVVVIWIGFYGLLNARFENSSLVYVSLAITLAFILATDLIKALFASKLEVFFTAQNLKKLNLVFAVLLFIFAVRLIIEYVKI